MHSLSLQKPLRLRVPALPTPALAVALAGTLALAFLAPLPPIAADDGPTREGTAKTAPATGAPGAKPSAALLAQKVEPFLGRLMGRAGDFALEVAVEGTVSREAMDARLRVARRGAEDFLLQVEHPQYPVIISRTAEKTVIDLPASRSRLEATGPIESPDTLRPEGLLARVLSPDTAVAPVAQMLATPGPAAVAIAASLLGLSSEDGQEWSTKKAGGLRIGFEELDGGASLLVVRAGELTVRVRALGVDEGFRAKSLPEPETTRKVDRKELERLYSRGLRRALEVLAPGPSLVTPDEVPRSVEHGELRWEGGLRVALLRGTPREVGEAHGKLLAMEARRCLESTVYLVGGVETLRSGKWFPDELRAAYQRLDRFIPEDHKAEIDAIARGAGLDREELQLASVFPELFHCSGFALFGKATVDGKLYHGRVLDYMTLIGLQDSATILVVTVDGKIPFVNVGYAGFVGSVSGMNARKISLGEMGGKGEGRWDGVPMATLMRRALEECSSLAEVQRLWSTSPRTCEYYYVFADGNARDAVGVAATPESITFVKPGEAHPLLGDGIPDAVVLSAGDRLQTLRQRVLENHGKIDPPKALWLMSRPVAMTSNLHNVLFLPEDLVLYVAHASGKEIAANRPYARLDLGQLLESPLAAAR